MAYYYITDAFSTWNVADPAFPEELPSYGERIYLAIVDGPVGQNSTKSLSTVYEGQYMGLDWLKNWYKELHQDPAYGPNATIIWVKIAPKPLLPEEWKVCGPNVCEDHHCPGYDNGYCMSDDGDHCPKAKVHKEFSIVRHAKKPQQCDPATTHATLPAHTGVSTLFRHEVRQKLIRLICESTQKTGTCSTETFHDCRTSRGDCGYCTILADFLLDNAVSIRRWIPLSERWPTAEFEVAKVSGLELYPCLIVKAAPQAPEQRCITKAYFDGKEFVDTDGIRIANCVTHWQPLPDLPKIP